MNRLPVRVRLTLPFALAMLVVLAALGAFVYIGVGRAMLSTTDIALRVQADDSSRHVDVGEDPLDRDALESATIAEEFSATGTATYSSRTFGAPLLSTADVERVARGTTIKTFAHPPALAGPWRILAFPVKTPSGTVVVAIGRSAGERAETLDHLKHGFLLAVPAALLAATIAGYLLAASALRPVEEMRRRAQAISASTPDSRLPVPAARDEVRRLAETLNDMLDRLQDSFEHERRFLADASHELRTPLALLQTELDLALRRPRSPAELEDALRSAAEETVRLTRLAEDLLLLARSDQGELTVRPETLSARALLEECVGRFQARVEASGRSLTIEPGEDITLSGDPLRIEQGLSNLLENAFTHGTGNVTVAAEAEGAMVAFHVRDHGPGFPAGFADRAFDRFTRADEARSTSGTGLGLAIVAAIARAHGGKAEIRPGTVGADIALVLPRSYAPGYPVPLRLSSREVALDHAFLNAVRAALPSDALIEDEASRRTYECDGLTGRRSIPDLVIIPANADDVRAAVRLCHAHGVPFVARGAGTGLSGGSLPVAEGVVIGLSRLNQILEVDLVRGHVVVQPGVTNLAVTKAVSAAGWYYAPDPSSQQVCTIGGNVAENSGGAHCLKHGFTVNHVLSADVVLPDGELVTLSRDDTGPDLLGLFVGSEGTLGIVVSATLRLLRTPQAVRTWLAGFESTDKAGDAVSQIIGSGILPSAIEMMDALTIQAAEAAVAAGYPAGAGAVLLVEVDGPQIQVDDDSAAIEAICRSCGAFEMRAADTADERARLWKGRKSAFAAVGRISPNYYVQDGVVPRTKLPEVLRSIAALEVEHGLRIGNVFHAGDGNLHPLVLYDAAIEGQAELAERVAVKILDLCIAAGGSLTGEHGVGVDKACSMPKLFGADDLGVMLRVRDAIDPAGIANPGKVFPTPRLCGEVPGPYRVHPLESAGLADRF